MQKLEADLVNLVAATHSQEIVACWIGAASSFADLARGLEAAQFPEMPELMARHEAKATFLALVDSRPDQSRVVHVMRLSSTAIDADGQCTGPALVDVLVASGQGLTWTVVRDYFDQAGIEHSRCIAVESNFRVGPKVDTPSGLPTADIAYMSIYNEWLQFGGLPDRSVIFAHVNRASLISFRRIGFEVRAAFAREELRTPTLGGGFDESYQPVEIPLSPLNARLFEELRPLAGTVMAPA